MGLTYVAGDVLGIAYDAGSNLVWLNKNSGVFSAPAPPRATR